MIESTKMKALVLEKHNELVHKDVPEPLVSDEDVLVQVKVCGICGYIFLPFILGSQYLSY